MIGANPAIAPAIADDEARGFPGLPCLYCDKTDCVVVDLANMTFHCNECDTDFTRDFVHDTITRWVRVMAWINLAPVTE